MMKEKDLENKMINPAVKLEHQAFSKAPENKSNKQEKESENGISKDGEETSKN